jgi:hypothetical protein
MATAAEGFLRLLSVLDRMEIAYLVGGSVASSVHGISTPTMNVDLVADLAAQQIDEFCASLQADFYADAPMIREALARGRPFNIIHMASSFKVDIFPLGRDPIAKPPSPVAGSSRAFRWVLIRLNARWRRRRIPFSANWNGIAREARLPSANGTIFAAF